MKTLITFINIKQVSTPVHYPAIQSSVHCPGAHCTAVALNNASTLSNLNAVIVKHNCKPVSSELKHHKKTIMHTIQKNSRKL